MVRLKKKLLNLEHEDIFDKNFSKPDIKRKENQFSQGDYPKGFEMFVDNLKIDLKPYIKILNENLTFIEIDFSSNNSIENNFKILLKVGENQTEYEIERALEFSLNINNSENMTNFLNSKIQLYLVQRINTEKKINRKIIATGEFDIHKVFFEKSKSFEGKIPLLLKRPNLKNNTIVSKNPANLIKIPLHNILGHLFVKIDFKQLGKETETTTHKEQMLVLEKTEKKINLGFLLQIFGIRGLKINFDYIGVELLGFGKNNNINQMIEITDIEDDIIHCHFDKILYLSNSFFETPQDLILKFVSYPKLNDIKVFLGYLKISHEQIFTIFCQDKKFDFDLYEEFMNTNNYYILNKGLVEVIDIKKHPKFFIEINCLIGKPQRLIDLIKEQSFDENLHSQNIQSNNCKNLVTNNFGSSAHPKEKEFFETLNQNQENEDEESLDDLKQNFQQNSHFSSGNPGNQEYKPFNKNQNSKIQNNFNLIQKSNFLPLNNLFHNFAQNNTGPNQDYNLRLQDYTILNKKGEKINSAVSSLNERCFSLDPKIQIIKQDLDVTIQSEEKSEIKNKKKETKMKLEKLKIQSMTQIYPKNNQPKNLNTFSHFEKNHQNQRFAIKLQQTEISQSFPAEEDHIGENERDLRLFDENTYITKSFNENINEKEYGQNEEVESNEEKNQDEFLDCGQNEVKFETFNPEELNKMPKNYTNNYSIKNSFDPKKEGIDLIEEDNIYKEENKNSDGFYILNLPHYIIIKNPLHLLIRFLAKINNNFFEKFRKEIDYEEFEDLISDKIIKKENSDLIWGILVKGEENFMVEDFIKSKKNVNDLQNQIILYYYKDIFDFFKINETKLNLIVDILKTRNVFFIDIRKFYGILQELGFLNFKNIHYDLVFFEFKSMIYIPNFINLIFLFKKFESFQKLNEFEDLDFFLRKKLNISNVFEFKLEYFLKTNLELFKREFSNEAKEHIVSKFETRKKDIIEFYHSFKQDENFAFFELINFYILFYNLLLEKNKSETTLNSVVSLEKDIFEDFIKNLENQNNDWEEYNDINFLFTQKNNPKSFNDYKVSQKFQLKTDERIVSIENLSSEKDIKIGDLLEKYDLNQKQEDKYFKFILELETIYWENFTQDFFGEKFCLKFFTAVNHHVFETNYFEIKMRDSKFEINSQIKLDMQTRENSLKEYFQTKVDKFNFELFLLKKNNVLEKFAFSTNSTRFLSQEDTVYKNRVFFTNLNKHANELLTSEINHFYLDYNIQINRIEKKDFSDKTIYFDKLLPQKGFLTFKSIRCDEIFSFYWLVDEFKKIEPHFKNSNKKIFDIVLILNLFSKEDNLEKSKVTLFSFDFITISELIAGFQKLTKDTLQKFLIKKQINLQGRNSQHLICENQKFELVSEIKQDGMHQIIVMGECSFNLKILFESPNNKGINLFLHFKKNSQGTEILNMIIHINYLENDIYSDSFLIHKNSPDSNFIYNLKIDSILTSELSKNKKIILEILKNQSLVKLKDLSQYSAILKDRVFIEDEFFYFDCNDQVEIHIKKDEFVLKTIKLRLDFEHKVKNDCFFYFINFEDYRIVFKLVRFQTQEIDLIKKDSLIKKITQIFNSEIFKNSQKFKINFDHDILKENETEFILKKNDFELFLSENFETIENENNLLVNLFRFNNDNVNIKKIFVDNIFPKGIDIEICTEEIETLKSLFRQPKHLENGFIDVQSLESLLQDNLTEKDYRKFLSLINFFIFKNIEIYIKTVDAPKLFELSQIQINNNKNMKTSTILNNEKFDCYLFKYFLNSLQMKEDRIWMNENKTFQSKMQKTYLNQDNNGEKINLKKGFEVNKIQLKNAPNIIEIYLSNFNLCYFDKRETYPNIFFVLKINEEKNQSKIVFRSGNPHWAESFSFSLDPQRIVDDYKEKTFKVVFYKREFLKTKKYFDDEVFESFSFSCADLFELGKFVNFIEELKVSNLEEKKNFKSLKKSFHFSFDLNISKNLDFLFSEKIHNTFLTLEEIKSLRNQSDYVRNRNDQIEMDALNFIKNDLNTIENKKEYFAFKKSNDKKRNVLDPNIINFIRNDIQNDNFGFQELNQNYSNEIKKGNKSSVFKMNQSINLKANRKFDKNNLRFENSNFNEKLEFQEIQIKNSDIAYDVSMKSNPFDNCLMNKDSFYFNKSSFLKKSHLIKTENQKKSFDEKIPELNPSFNSKTLNILENHQDKNNERICLNDDQQKNGEKNNEKNKSKTFLFNINQKQPMNKIKNDDQHIILDENSSCNNDYNSSPNKSREKVFINSKFENEICLDEENNSKNDLVKNDHEDKSNNYKIFSNLDDEVVSNNIQKIELNAIRKNETNNNENFGENDQSENCYDSGYLKESKNLKSCKKEDLIEGSNNLNYQKVDNIRKENLNEIVKKIPKEYFSKNEINRITRIMKTEKLGPGFFDFDSDSD